MSMVPECPVCGASITINIDNVVGELVDCEECGVMLEITSIDPPEIDEAPEEEEDWGE
jgi:alpha-aminoadipate carrier protein LysW